MQINTTYTTCFLSTAIMLLLVPCCHTPIRASQNHECICHNTPKILGKVANINAFIRSVEYEPDHFALQTASRVLCKSACPTVQLLATIHIGESEYYKKLQEITSQADIVLYEGIGKQSMSAHNSQFSMYRGIAKNAGLETQSSEIDYLNTNFRRCDLNIDDIKELLESQTSESKISAAQEFYLMQQKFTTEAVNSYALLQFNHWNKKNVALQRLHLIAMGIEPNKSVMKTNLRHVLHDQRNSYVISHIKQIIEKENHQHIVVLYGAAHMPQIATLLLQYGYNYTRNTLWHDAIQCYPLASGLSHDEVFLKLKRAK